MVNYKPKAWTGQRVLLIDGRSGLIVSQGTMYAKKEPTHFYDIIIDGRKRRKRFVENNIAKIYKQRKKIDF